MTIKKFSLGVADAFKVHAIFEGVDVCITT